MNCSKGVCPQTSNDPQISVFVIDQDGGSGWGFYCNYECALNDTGATLMHLMEGGSYDNLPKPKPDEAISVVNVTPEAVVFDDSWHVNQAYADELANSLSKSLKSTVTKLPEEVHSNGKKIQGYSLGYGNIAVRVLSNDDVLIDLHSDDFNIQITPSDFPVNEIVKQYLGHVTTVVKNQNVQANTSPF
jgi:hypothetical protein